MPSAMPVTPGEERIRLLYRMRARRLLWRMMARQGIDPTGRWWHGAEPMIARAAENCAACAATAECTSWLDGGKGGCGTPGFCPNGRAIEAARIMDPTAPPLATPREADRVPESALADVLAEPIVKLMMKADGVNGEVLRHAMTDSPRFAAAFAAPELRWGPRR
jgi:hypothetical protein